jgi:hypothetical protein
LPDDYYQVLGLKANCSQDDIKQAYRNRAKLYHPDVNRSAKASETMKRINIAYATLSDPEKRKSYDNYLREKSDRRYTGYQDSSGHRRSYNSTTVKRKSVFNLWAKSAVQTYAVVFFILLLAGSITYFYVKGSSDISSQPSGHDLYLPVQPTIAVTVSSGPLSMPPLAYPTVQATSIPSPCPTPTPTPKPSPSPTIDPLSVEKDHVPATAPSTKESSGKGIVTGYVTMSGSIIGADGAYVAICDAADPNIEYYTTTAGIGGYFMFPAVNNTLAQNSTPIDEYVLYSWDNTLRRGNYTQPFNVEPYWVTNEDILIN